MRLRAIVDRENNPKGVHPGQSFVRVESSTYFQDIRAKSPQLMPSDNRCHSFWKLPIDSCTYKSGAGVGAGVGGVGVADGAAGTTGGDALFVVGCDAGIDVTACFKSQPVSSNAKRYVPAFN